MKIGIDIASITRIKKSHERLGAAFLSKFLRKSEIKILRKNSQSIAGFWAAKEAAPILEFSKKTRKFFKIKKASLSISHDGDFAVAVVAIKGKK